MKYRVLHCRDNEPEESPPYVANYLIRICSSYFMKKEIQNMSRKEFVQRWIKNLVETMDVYLDEDTKVAIMESCGRACARERAIHAAQECNGNLDKFLATIKKWIGRNNVSKDGNVIQLVYNKCFCPLVSEGYLRLPDTYCYCSRGWLQEMFEEVVGSPVAVTLTESIKRGSQKCRFTILLALEQGETT